MKSREWRSALSFGETLGPRTKGLQQYRARSKKQPQTSSFES
jgi:hypothetical protein